MASSSSENEVTRKYRLPAKFIFYPANFWEHKNHLNMVEAMAVLKKELPDLALVLAGSRQNAYDAVMRRIDQLDLTNDVRILGYVPDEDMAGLYRKARALVMPTFFGPTNIPPLEAFAAGCPVSVSGIYGMPEQTGDAALLFDPSSVQGIAECIRRLWTDDRLCADLVLKGKERAASWGQQHFNARLHTIIEAVLQV